MSRSVAESMSESELVLQRWLKFNQKGIAMVTARNAVRESGVRYKRHQPELTLLCQIIETHYPEFLGYMESQGKTLPNHIKKEFEAYLKCCSLEQGFIPGILPFTPSGPAFGCSNTLLTYLSASASLFICPLSKSNEPGATFAEINLYLE